MFYDFFFIYYHVVQCLLRLCVYKDSIEVFKKFQKHISDFFCHPCVRKVNLIGPKKVNDVIKNFPSTCLTKVQTSLPGTGYFADFIEYCQSAICIDHG